MTARYMAGPSRRTLRAGYGRNGHGSYAPRGIRAHAGDSGEHPQRRAALAVQDRHGRESTAPVTALFDLAIRLDGIG